MRSNSREEIVEVFDALAADLDRALELDLDALTPRELIAILRRCETLRRRLPALEHPAINALATVDPVDLGGKLRTALADELHLSSAEAGRRITDAAELGPRRTLAGQPLDPIHAAVAAAQRAGTISTAHIEVIRSFFHYLPDHIDPDTRAICERNLTSYASAHRPDEFSRFAHQLADRLHPDGNYTEHERAARRGIRIGRQGHDGMTPINGFLDPLTRASLDAVLARWAAPGMANPADDTPCTTGTPSQTQIDADRRNAWQRNHDALALMCRALLASGELGQHNGLPAAIIVSTSLAELQAAAGKAHTGGGTWLSMSEVIALASHAHHYLRIYDGGKELALFHTKRLANPAQRLVLHAKERGCSHPGCPIPGYLCEVHHDDDYAATHRTDIDDLTFRCGPHHKLLASHAWKTRKRHDGTTETLPPPHLDHGQARINLFHHPEKLLQDNESGDDDGDPD